MNILRPLPKKEIKSFFSEHSLKVFQHFMNVSIFAQPEVSKTEDSLPIQIPKEHLEQWFVQALQVKSVGAGSSPIDILEPKKWGADIKMLSCKLDDKGKLNGADSGETSLAQKFTGTGASLDKMFENKQFQLIINGWIDLWKTKLANAKKENSIDEIYYFFFLRGTKQESYLCAFEVDVDNINTTKITQRDKDNEIKKTTSKIKKTTSIFLDGVIDSKYGNSKIYKSKKRLELRLKPKQLLEDGFLIPIATETPNKEDMYGLVQDKDKYNQYMKNKIYKILDYSKI
jgi:hypothetical protein